MAEPPILLDPHARRWTLASAALALLPLLLQLPTQLATVIAASALLTAAVSRRGLLPVPVRLLLVLAMLALIYLQLGARPGRDTGCALLAAMLAIKTSELRSLRDARSLLGFSLFAPFAAFLLDQGPLTTALGALAAVCALLALQRLAQAESQASRPPLRQQIQGVGRLLLLGLPLALATFWLFPRLAEPLWGLPERAVGTPGLSDTLEPGQWLDLMADDAPAFRVQFQGPVPTAAERYWRGPVMSRFDGRRWEIDRSAERAALPAIRPRPVQWRYTLDYEPTERRQLVALDLPSTAPAGTRLTADHSLLSDLPLASLTRWTLQSSPPLAYAADLGEYQRRQALQLPEGFNPRTQALARRWRAEVGNDDAALIERTLAWIRAEFTYSIDAPLPGRDTADDFLFEQKIGFCEHYSSAFVILMRNAGIPARVVTGFAGGIRNPIGDYWVLRRMDAHAWAEVWLPQRGWVRVDPTAAVAPERILDTLEDQLGAEGGAAAGGWTQTGQALDWLRRGWNDLVLSYDAKRQRALLRPFGVDALDSGQLAAVLVVLVGAALGVMAWLLARGERERDPLLRAWHHLGRRYARLGLGREPSEPAQAWAERVHAKRADPQLLALSARFVAARYAGARDDPASLRGDLRRHRPTSGAPS
ncbi:DUF3488 and transglutaminase-like domain-containing protein [Xanthomonas sp. 60]